MRLVGYLKRKLLLYFNRKTSGALKGYGVEVCTTSQWKHTAL